jgi:general stress protein 26
MTRTDRLVGGLERTGRRLAISLAAAFVWVAPCQGQETVTEERALEVVRETMQAAEYCFLITLDETGHPQARVMDPFDPEPDMTVWLATDRTTRKVRHLRDDPRATLAYYDAENAGYVTMAGHIRLVDDPGERRARWNEDWAPYYPGGPTGDRYILLEFSPSRIEVMSFGLRFMDGPFAPAVLTRDGTEWKISAR